MFLEIEEKLQEIYNLKIVVTYLDYGLYEIKAEDEVIEIKINYAYDRSLTFEANIASMVNKINTAIANIYMKGK